MFSTSKTSVKKVFLKNPQENTCAQVSETLTQVFSCAFCEFLRTHIYRAPPVATFWKLKNGRIERGEEAYSETY